MLNNKKPEGIFNNGDLWYGEGADSEGYYPAYEPTTDPDTGPDYGTQEEPERFPLFAMTIFPDGTPESFATEYLLARRQGDQRFGSACQHARSKRGYCPDCLRRVI